MIVLRDLERYFDPETVEKIIEVMSQDVVRVPDLTEYIHRHGIRPEVRNEAIKEIIRHDEDRKARRAARRQRVPEAGLSLFRPDDADSGAGEP